MGDEGVSLKEAVHDSITKIMAGLPEGIRLKDDIKFELSVILSKDISGNIDFKVLKTGANVNKEEIQKITFSVTDKEPEIDPIKEAEKKLLKRQGLI
ncbi:hypothetical protein HYX00_01510 [Candidatus Woesearchaeota archaeon]|nr:hypothetical protein [Candidatus Woesearchaeota archaeon]